VGINGTPGNYRLDVTGSARISDDLLVADYLDVDGAATVAGTFDVGTVLRVNTAGTRIGINRVADQQFDLDIAGAARAQYWIGPHALQLKNAAAIIQFDGPAPYALDYSGSSLTHMGVSPTTETAVIYRPGRFGKAAQLAAGTTNLVANPSFEADAIGATTFTGWNLWGSPPTREIAAGGLYGEKCLRLITNGTNQGVLMGQTVTSGTTYTISFYVYVITGRPTIYMTGTGVSTFDAELPSGWTGNNLWNRYSYTFTATANGTCNIYLGRSGGGVNGEYLFDAVQFEQQVHASPYCDGSLGSGHAWTGTEHASTSTRASSSLAYSKLVNPAAYTVGGWFKVTLAENTAISDVFRPRFIQVGSFNNNVTGSATVAVYSGIGITVLFTRKLNEVNTWTLHGVNAANANYEPGEWVFIALSYNGSVHKVYVGRETAGDAGWFEYTSTAIPDHYSLAERLSLSWTACTGLDLVDGVFVLDEAADAKLIRSIYESNAPVFAESSVVSFRAPTKSQIWVDEFGFWAKGQSGGEAFGIFGGDPRRLTTTKSWGGVTMEENDIVIGRTSAPSYTALHWDDSAGELILGRRSGEHISLTAGYVRIKNTTTTYASLNNAEFILGNVAEENLRLTTSGIEFRNATEVQGSLSGTSWTLGKTGASENNIVITPTSISLNRGGVAHATLTGTDFQLGTVENIRVTPTVVEFRNSSTVIGSLDGTTLTLGQITVENVRITSTALEFRNATEVQGSLDGTTWTLGKTGTGENNVQITPTTLSLRSGANKHAELTSAGVLTLGLTSSGDYITIDGTNGVRLYGNSSLLGQWTAAGGVVIGAVANSTSRIEITSGAVNIINRSAGGADTTAISLSSSGSASFTGSITATSGTVGGWTLGESSLTGGSATLSSTGKLTIGTGNNVLIADAANANYRLYIGHATPASAPFSVTKTGGLTSSLGVIGGWTITSDRFQGGADARLYSTGKMALGSIYGMVVIDPNHADWRIWSGVAADIESNPLSSQFRVSKHGQLTASGATIYGHIVANSGDIAGVLTVGASGGIYQGTGSFASPTTGLKIWNDSGVGRIGGYNAGALQWYAGTDGKLYAGGGNVRLDAGGVAVAAPTTYYSAANAFGFTRAGVAVGGLLALATASETAMVIGANTVDASAGNPVAAESNRDARVAIWAKAQGTGKHAALELKALAGDGVNSAQITMGTNASPWLQLSATTITLDGNVECAYEVDFGSWCRVAKLVVDGDPGGVSTGEIALSNQTSNVSTGVGTVKMGGASNANSTGWLKIYVAGNARYIPFWSVIAG